jgi:hypothetical protein
MKNLLSLLISVTFLGCNSDDDVISVTDGTDNHLLVKSINWTYAESDRNFLVNCTEEFTYESDKILQVVRSTRTTRPTTGTRTEVKTMRYIYTNNLISTVSIYKDNQELQEQLFLEYDNSDRLISYEVFTDGQLEFYTSFVYDSSNTSYISTTIFAAGVTTSEIQISNGNKVLDESITVRSGFNDSYARRTMSYDNKHNPFENIIGLPAYNTLQITKSHDISNFGKNNVVAYERTDDDGVWGKVMNFDYNDEGYPRNIVGKECDTCTSFSDTVIEYY